MFPVLLLLFILVPVIEIGLFIQVGGWLGLWPTLALVLITAFVGASLVRNQGLMTLASVQDRLNRGELPAQQILEGVMLAVAGVLLLTPGFMTDAMGMLVLLPAPRAALAKQVMKRVTVSQAGFGQGGFHQGGNTQGPFGDDPFRRGGRDDDGNTFEGEYERKDDDDDDNHRLR
ncbi:membrane protein FxsA [Salinivibrio sp. MA351]|uniref:Membrane protein FxsA n=1 Tax=Salinivibrio costicola subsp. alcaliphilus TaxID=272773 RepID=A0ABX3KQ02_SALCS|nr:MULTISPECIES: FxsA family protein [Salinivibrio]NUY57439.1 membrane protein FxsA [Salinivibrio sp. EAGSL]OOE89181.1 membrane protein FxsA [Salinivibrio sp. AR647]OOE91102.1 membrane protein FxsA [Salinivibrio sp. AR640]OOE98137.1 membrane protein FxsA [Salinivibrio sp. MA351]OOF16970.1 membrane protein FxsA [Salinivibrio sp. MA427]